MMASAQLMKLRRTPPPPEIKQPRCETIRQALIQIHISPTKTESQARRLTHYSTQLDNAAAAALPPAFALHHHHHHNDTYCKEEASEALRRPAPDHRLDRPRSAIVASSTRHRPYQQRAFSAASTKLWNRCWEPSDKVTIRRPPRGCAHCQVNKAWAVSRTDPHHATHITPSHKYAPLIEPWAERSKRAHDKRLKLERQRLQRAQKVVARYADREARQLRAQLQHSWLTIASAIQFCAVLGCELEFERTQDWNDVSTFASGDDATAQDVSLAPGETTTITPASCASTNRVAIPNQPSLSRSLRHYHHKSHHYQSHSREQRRRHVHFKAANFIQHWYIRRKVERVFNANRCVPEVLRRFVRLGEQRFRRTKREHAMAIVRDFLYTTRRSARLAVRKVGNAVRLVQSTIRAASRCRLARLALLERAFVREERARRDRAIEERRRDALAALERTKSHPDFGPRAARLFDASARLHKLFVVHGNSVVARRLRERVALSSSACNVPSSRRPSQSRYKLDDTDLLLDPVYDEDQPEGALLRDDEDDKSRSERRSASLDVPSGDSAFVPTCASERRAFVDSLLISQRKLHLKRIEAKQLHAISYQADIEDVKRLYFPHQPEFADSGTQRSSVLIRSDTDRSLATTRTLSSFGSRKVRQRRSQQLTPKLLVCQPPTFNTHEPFLLLTPHDGALAEIRAFVHGTPSIVTVITPVGKSLI